MQASRVPVHFGEKRYMPVPVPKPVPDLRCPVRDVGGQDDYAVVDGLVGLDLDRCYLRRATCPSLSLAAPNASSLYSCQLRRGTSSPGAGCRVAVCTMLLISSRTSACPARWSSRTCPCSVHSPSRGRIFLAGDLRLLGTLGGGGVSSSTQVGTACVDEDCDDCDWLAASCEGAVGL